MKTLILLLLAATLFTSCEKVGPGASDILTPPTFFVLLDGTGAELLTSTATPLRVTTTVGSNPFELGAECAGGGCTMVKEFPNRALQPHRFVYGSVELSDYSLGHTQRWYLTLNGKTDTLDYHVKDTSSGTTGQRIEVVQATFNGQPVQPEAQLRGQFGGPFFVLRRRH